MGMFIHIVELFKDIKTFVKQRTNHEIKIIALLVYHTGLSYRKIRKIIGNLETLSYKALIKWNKKCVIFFSS
jgi:transposase